MDREENRVPSVFLKFLVPASVYLVMQSTALAQCAQSYRFTWDKDDRGTVSNVTVGETCRIPVFIRGDTNLDRIEVVRRPKGIRIEQESTSILIVADKSFSGTGTMLVRFHGIHSRTNAARRSDVEFEISLKK